MDCPRCGSTLERYTLGDRSAVTCGSCGYAGVSVDHRGERQRVETWTEAISRVPDAARIASVTVETAADDPSLEVVFESSTDGDEAAPEPTVVRVERPDPKLAAALSAADGADEFICEICGRGFDRRAQLYGHLATHSNDSSDDV